MALISLPVDHILSSFNDHSKEIVMFKHDRFFFGLKAKRGTYRAGQVLSVVLSEDGNSISWPPPPAENAPPQTQ